MTHTENLKQCCFFHVAYVGIDRISPIDTMRTNTPTFQQRQQLRHLRRLRSTHARTSPVVRHGRAAGGKSLSSSSLVFRGLLFEYYMMSSKSHHRVIIRPVSSGFVNSSCDLRGWAAYYGLPTVLPDGR